MDTLNRIEAAVVQAVTAAILNGGAPVGEVSPAPRKRAPKASSTGSKRRLSAAGRAAISRAAKRRWAAHRSKKAKRSPRVRKAKPVPTAG